jgi:hypothetical protein
MFKLRINGEGTMVPGMVMGVLMGVTVGGTWPVVSRRMIYGAVHTARSLVAEPVARMVRMKRTF